MQIFRYELGKESFQVGLGPWTVREIPYSDIESVREGYEILNENWSNPFPFRFVTIRMRSGIFRNFVINPPDRKGFIYDLTAKLAG